MAQTSGGSVEAVTLESLSVSVVYLRENDGERARIGTGFLVRSAQSYLVTASHVAVFLTPESKATFRTTGDVPLTVTLGDLFTGGLMLPWHRHAEADIAVLPLKPNEKALSLIQDRPLKIAMLVAQEGAPPRERPVTVMGFPLALGTTGRFSPLTSEAKPASGLVRITRTDTKKEETFFMLDKPSIGGYSGAPVFLIPGPFFSEGTMKLPGAGAPTWIVGLVSGTISDDTGGKLAAIVPAKFIRDTILEADRQANKPPQ